MSYVYVEHFMDVVEYCMLNCYANYVENSKVPF